MLTAYPTGDLLTRDEFKGSIANEINQILNLVYVLLAMALVIALFGIANTLALSVFERTREFGLLRAVGHEPGAGAVDGAVGVGVDRAARHDARHRDRLGFGWALVRAMDGQGITQMSVPVGELGVIVVLAAVAAVSRRRCPPGGPLGSTC